MSRGMAKLSGSHSNKQAVYTYIYIIATCTVYIYNNIYASINTEAAGIQLVYIM